MSDAATAAPVRADKLGFGQSVIRGKLTRQKRHKGQDGVRFVGLVAMPAVDAYSKPSVVELRGESSLGEVGAESQWRVQIGGYPRQFATTDPETGERVQVFTAQVTLDVVA